MNRVLMNVCATIGGFAASAYWALLALSANPSGYLPDSISLLIVGSLPIGAWLGAFVSWAIGRIVWPSPNNNVPLSSVNSTGCLGTLFSWLLIIIFLPVIGVKGD